MPRESLPAFDLYGELEVSRSASEETIEAVYRSMVKRHHPDVAGTDDERIKRINVAHDWLTDPVRRKRYDTATGPTPALVPNRRTAEAPASDDARFGPNADDVRRFLIDLGGIDVPRAEQVRDGQRAADARGYAGARRTTFTTSRAQRLGEWLFARDAASNVVRSRLGASALTNEVAESLADVAGALAVRDLIARSDFELLLLPWTWREERIGPRAGAVASAPVMRATFAAARRATPPPRAAPAPRAATAPSVPRERPRATGLTSRRKTLAGWGASLTALVAVVSVLAFGGSLTSPGRPASVTLPSFNDVGLGAEATGPAGGEPSALLATPAVFPSPTPSIDPAQLATLQAGAWQTIRDLTAAADAVDVKAAKALLGGTAPRLQKSGLRRATFPDVAPGAIAIERAGTGWRATAGADHLTSTDGTHWAFDYADRPLAWFGRTSEHDLYWLGPNGRHDVYLAVTSLTVARSGVTVRFAWRYGDGAAWFAGDDLVITSITLGSQAIPIADGFVATLGAGTLKAALRVPGTLEGSASIAVGIAVLDRPAPGAPPVRSVSTTFELRAR